MQVCIVFVGKLKNYINTNTIEMLNIIIDSPCGDSAVVLIVFGTACTVVESQYYG